MDKRGIKKYLEDKIYEATRPIRHQNVDALIGKEHVERYFSAAEKARLKSLIKKHVNALNVCNKTRAEYVDLSNYRPDGRHRCSYEVVTVEGEFESFYSRLGQNIRYSIDENELKKKYKALTACHGATDKVAKFEKEVELKLLCLDSKGAEAFIKQILKDLDDLVSSLKK